jgi:hypothetical protein
MVQVKNIVITEFCLSTDIHIINSNNEGDFKITGVYGPMASNRKDHLCQAYWAQGVRWFALDSPPSLRAK